MKNETNLENEKICEHYHGQGWKHRHYYENNTHGGNAVYGLGMVGAAVFYISQATSFWVGVLGLLKALVWPALLVYEALKFLIK